MHLTLFIPDLLPLPGTQTDAGNAPLLRRVLGRGHLRRSPANSAEAWLCSAFEVEKQHDWPVAPLTAVLDGLVADTGTWLRADPVHLQLQRNQTFVLAAPALQIESDEAQALAKTLNEHFATEGFTFHAPYPARWYLGHSVSHTVSHSGNSGPDTPAAITPSLSSLAGHPLRGEALSGAWHRRLTEIQMLLHAHPVNAAREARGAPAINSLLLWGGGCMPAVPGRFFKHVWTNDALATALALASHAACRPAPANAPAWLASLPRAHSADTRHLITLESAHVAARYGGQPAWQQIIAAIEDDWLAPLLKAFSTPLTLLDIVTTGPAQCLQFTVRATDRYRFWRGTPDWKQLTGTAT